MNEDIAGIIAERLYLPELLAARLVSVEWSRAFKNPPLKYVTNFNGAMICACRHDYELYIKSDRTSLQTRGFFADAIDVYSNCWSRPRKNLPIIASVICVGDYKKIAAAFGAMFGDLSGIPLLYRIHILREAQEYKRVGNEIIIGDKKIRLETYKDGQSLRGCAFAANGRYMYMIPRDSIEAFADVGWSVYEHIYYATGQFCRDS